MVSASMSYHAGTVCTGLRIRLLVSNATSTLLQQHGSRARKWMYLPGPSITSRALCRPQQHYPHNLFHPLQRFLYLLQRHPSTDGCYDAIALQLYALADTALICIVSIRISNNACPPSARSNSMRRQLVLLLVLNCHKSTASGLPLRPQCVPQK